MSDTKSMSLNYEPFSEPHDNSAKEILLNRELDRFGNRVTFSTAPVSVPLVGEGRRGRQAPRCRAQAFGFRVYRQVSAGKSTVGLDQSLDWFGK